MNAKRVVADLRELAARTCTPDGAQRVAWGPVWRDARAWFEGKVAELGLHIETDAAGNNWVTLPGESPRTVIIGGHLDSVPNGGWLDGALGVLAGLEALRDVQRVDSRRSRWRWSIGPTKKARVSAGACSDSSAAQPAVSSIDDVRDLMDRQGTRLVDALRENGVDLDRMLDAHRRR